jgi:RNA polymerase sigma factor (TIGR02999 family)
VGKDPTHHITRLLAGMSEGDSRAREALLPLVYDELRRLAGAYLKRERRDHTLQATALVHEAYIRLVEQNDVAWRNRAHFFGIAAQLMRRILVDHARARLAAKRGGELARIPLTDAVAMSHDRPDELLVLDESLSRLAALDPRQAQVVELRVFGGMTMDEVAVSLETSLATSKRDWTVAKAWLLRELGRAGRP